MKSNIIKAVVMPAVILTLICIIAAGGLAVTNSITKDRIAQKELEDQKAAMSRIIPADGYISKKATLDGKEYEFYIAETGGQTIGYLFSVSNFGYGGQVKVMTGVDTSGKIAAVEVLSAGDETPGLGGNSLKESFWKEFIGKKGQLTVSKNASDSSEIQAITGATITSRSVVKSVNTALRLYEIAKEVH